VVEKGQGKPKQASEEDDEGKPKADPMVMVRQVIPKPYLRQIINASLKTKFLLLAILIYEHYCTYLKIKRTNLRSLGRGTIGIYIFSRWSVHCCLVYAL
jgi:hypothetical protein